MNNQLGAPVNSHNVLKYPAFNDVYDFVIDCPYWLIEADAVFHNVSLEDVIRRYLAARLQEVGGNQ